MKAIFTLLTMVLFFVTGFSQTGPAITQNIVAGGDNVDRGLGIDSTFDGGIVLAGSTTSNSNSLITRRVANTNTDALVMRYDINGNLIWSKCYGGTNNDVLNDIIQTQDGGFIAVGKSNSIDFDLPAGNDATFSNMWIVKLSSTGAIEWSKVFGGTQAEEAMSVIQISDGSFIVAGVTASSSTVNFPASPSFGNKDMVLVKMDAAGNSPAFYRYGASRDDVPSRIIQLANGNYVVVGTTSSNNGMVIGNHYTTTITNDIWVVWLNSSLGHIQNRCYGSILGESGVTVEEMSNGHLIIAGTITATTDGDIRQLPSHANYEGWIARIDPALPRPTDTVWTRPIGGSDGDNLKSMVKASDGNVLVAMLAQSPVDPATDIKDKISAGNTSDIWVAKFNTNDGNILFSRSYGTSTADDVDKIMLWKSDNLLFVGTVQGTTRDFDLAGQPAYGASDMWMASARDIITLPIHLASFKGEIYNGYNKLQWRTDNESNGKEFRVERSTDGIEYKTIAVVAAAGESNTPRNYEYIDYHPAPTAMYRLRMVDRDGASTISEVLRLRRPVKATTLANAYVRGNNVVFSAISDKEQPAVLQLTDVSGRLIAARNIMLSKGSSSYDLPATSLQQGVYIAVLATKDDKSSIKIAK